MKKKNIISLSVALSFLTLSVTGLLLYLVQHNKPTVVIHVVFGLLFIAFAIFHIINNWSSLTAYSTNGIKIKREFLWSFAFTGAFLVGSYFLLPPFMQIEELGSKIRKRNSPPRVAKITFEEIETNAEENGKALRFIIQKGKETVLPTMVIWVEDSTHAFIDNVFVPAKTSIIPPGTEDVKRAIGSGKLEFRDFDADNFQQWKSKTTTHVANYPKETPADNFFLKTKTKASRTFFVMLEVNDQGKTEHYEALIDSSKGEVFKLKPVDEGKLINVLVEVQ